MIKAFGGWLFLDGIGSILLYYSDLNYEGKRQSWAKDHWLRVIRSKSLDIKACKVYKESNGT